MWVKTCEGHLVNLDQCTSIIFDHGALWVTFAGTLRPSLRCPLFSGSREECGRFLEKLHGELVYQDKGVEGPTAAEVKGVPHVG